MNKKIGIFYGPARGSNTEKVAQKVAREIGADQADMIEVKEATTEDLKKYDRLIFGVSTIGKETWDGYASRGDWDKFRPELDKADLKGKTIALFCLGDHVTYPRHFVDALGMIYEILQDKNVRIIGHVEPSGYEFEESQGIYDGKFVGLPIDEDFEPELTDQRVKNWVAQIRKEFDQ
ncbi:MAG: flavodoxin [Bacteroidales bacterium]|nr:flavodoxin [Bacteroidales bacterium]